MLDSVCPAATALTTVPYNPCVTIFGKDGRWVFQRLDDANNTFVNSTNGIEEESSWSALPDATDDTKVIITPRLEEPTFGDGDDLDDSENFDGAPLSVGSGPQLVTAMIRNPSAAQYAALRNLMDINETLTFYRIDDKGKFGARLIGSDHAGIKISPNTFRIKSPQKGPGRVDMTKVMIQFYLADGWFEDFAVVAPESGFDPLNEIKPS